MLLKEDYAPVNARRKFQSQIDNRRPFEVACSNSKFKIEFEDGFREGQPTSFGTSL